MATQPNRRHALVAALAGVVLLLAVVGGIASLLQGGDDVPTVSPSPAAAPSEDASEAPRPEAPESSEPSPEPVRTPEATPEQTLTSENNPELAALFATTEPCGGPVEAFAAKYDGRIVEFDVSVSFMANHEDFDTRYDFLISPGDQGAESTRGPNFKFEDVAVRDLNLSGPNVPDAIGVGDLLRVVARIDEYNSTQCLFFLDPVTTSFR